MHDRSTPPPRAAYWWCQAVGWGAYLLINIVAAQGFVALTWRTVGSFVWLSCLGVAVTHAFRGFILRRRWTELPARKLLPRVVAVNLFLAVLLVAAVWLYFLLLPQTNDVTWWRKTGSGIASASVVFVFNDFIILTLWTGIYFAVAALDRQRRMEIAHYEAKTALAEAELRGLKSQLNPHFLFNSLNSLRALVDEEPARARDAITELAAILRYPLQSGERSLVPLAEEVAMVERYLSLELIRFEDRLRVERQIDRAALRCLVPPLALQTLVENAVKYGVSRETEDCVMRISAQLRDKQLDISVRNTGTLERAAAGASTGLGLTNLRTRVRLLFGDAATLDLHEPEPGWVEARLLVPATVTALEKPAA